jgi:hypothetical protein
LTIKFGFGFGFGAAVGGKSCGCANAGCGCAGGRVEVVVGVKRGLELGLTVGGYAMGAVVDGALSVMAVDHMALITKTGDYHRKNPESL